MSKVICEICGTAYPDTEKECPVCGFEKPETAEFAPDDAPASSAEASGHVRGGRFSKSNVTRKSTPAAAPSRAAAKGRSKKRKAGSDIALIIAIIFLLLSIACTGAYIYFTYFAQPKHPADDAIPVATTTEPSKQTLPPQTLGTTEPEDLSCTGLTLHEQSVVLNAEGSEWLLNVVPTPANTTDEITYTSADQNVAVVYADGKIVAVGNGETVITITCGSVSVECKVICQIADDPTEPEETDPDETDPDETEPEETEPKETEPVDVGDFKLRKTDLTFDGKNQTYTLYNGDIDVKDIKWTVGNSSVATVKDGVVKAVGPGFTNVYAEYKGVKLSCVIRCDF